MHFLKKSAQKSNNISTDFRLFKKSQKLSEHFRLFKKSQKLSEHFRLFKKSQKLSEHFRLFAHFFKKCYLAILHPGQSIGGHPHVSGNDGSIVACKRVQIIRAYPFQEKSFDTFVS